MSNRFVNNKDNDYDIIRQQNYPTIKITTKVSCLWIEIVATRIATNV